MLSDSEAKGLPTAGTQVTFRDGEDTRNGIVNGVPQRYTLGGAVYLPVHVPETNENLMIDSRNLVTE